MQLRRGDVVVFSVSAALAATVVVAVAFSLLVLDRAPHSRTNEPGGSTSSLLVVTWGPSLCKVERSNAGCRSGHVGKLGQRWILHGLWPQPPSEQFCDVPKAIADRARDFKEVDTRFLNLPAEVRSKLQVMLSDSAVMVPHEWYAHGTCAGVAPAAYFSDTVALAEQVGKVLDPMFKKAVGRRLSLNTVRHRFDAEFGRGAGERISLTCREVDGEEIVIYEVHLSLPPVADFGAAGSTLSLGDLLIKGPTISAECRRGRVPR